MNLILDIGNTRTKAAIFHGDQILYRFVIGQKSLSDIEFDIDKCIISNTGDLDKELIESVLKLTDIILILDHRLELPFKNLYDTPSTLGRDRIAGIAGAMSLYPDQACLIIDAGTCITYDFVTLSGNYIGGNIAPGIDMRLQAMAHFTDKLPLVDTIYMDMIMARSTEAALQNGAVHGVLYEIEGIIEDLNKEHEEFNTILTGGAGHFLSQYVKRKIFVHPDLILIGLNKILILNAQ